MLPNSVPWNEHTAPTSDEAERVRRELRRIATSGEERRRHIEFVRQIEASVRLHEVAA